MFHLLQGLVKARRSAEVSLPLTKYLKMLGYRSPSKAGRFSTGRGIAPQFPQNKIRDGVWQRASFRQSRFPGLGFRHQG